jgi:oligopeptide transport system substrate-binding protein
MRVRYRRAVLLLTCGMLIAACGGGDQTGGEGMTANGGEYSVYICEPEALVPVNTNEVCGSEVLNALFSPLVDYDARTYEPLVSNQAPRAHAESITTTDNQTFTIKLKPGWMFHDRTPVTAQSYVDAWNYGAYQPNAQDNANFFAKIEGYEDLQCPDDKCAQQPASKQMRGLKAIDDTTLQVKLSAPFSQFPLLLRYTAFYPMPKSFFVDPKNYNEAPIGDGPFRMDGTWNHNQSIKVVRYEQYAGEPAAAGGITFKIYTNLETAYTDYEAGNLDVMDVIPRSKVASAQQLEEKFITGESSILTFLGFPLYDQRFQNADLRRAFSLAIDRKALTDTVRPDAVPADAFISPVVAGYRRGQCGQWCTFDPQRAKELLAKAGGWKGELVLWYNADGDHQTWMEALANQLRQNLGIQQIRFESPIFAQYNQLLDDFRATGPYRGGWVIDYPSPQNTLQEIFTTRASFNRMKYSNPEFDKLIAQGNAAGSIQEGLQYYNQAEDLLANDLPVIPLFFNRLIAVRSDRVSGVQIDLFDHVNTADIVVKG